MSADVNPTLPDTGPGDDSAVACNVGEHALANSNMLKVKAKTTMAPSAPGCTTSTDPSPSVSSPPRARPRKNKMKMKTEAPAACSGKKQVTSPGLDNVPDANGGVWSVSGTKHLIQGLCPAATPLPPASPPPQSSKRIVPDEVIFHEHYACARGAYRLRFDGRQRLMTALEEETLQLWTASKIHLFVPPKFVTETHTGPERDVLWSYQRNTLGFRLYAQLPVGFVLPEVSTKWHFCHSLLLANQKEADKQRAKLLLGSAHQTICSARSQIVKFTFTRPEDRDMWADKTFNFGRGFFTLRATDALADKDGEDGYDAAAIALLYQIHVIGRNDLDATAIRSWMSTATDAKVMTVEAQEPSGLDGFGPHIWAVTFDTISCPVTLENKRLLKVRTGDKESLLYLHHPRAAHRFPCKACLSVQHYRKDCTERNVTQCAVKYTLEVQTATLPNEPTIAAASTVRALRRQMKEVRKQLAPELAERHRLEKKEIKLKAVQKASKDLAAAAAAAAKLRNAEVRQKQQEAARLKQKAATSRQELRAQMTTELKGGRVQMKKRMNHAEASISTAAPITATTAMTPQPENRNIKAGVQAVNPATNITVSVPKASSSGGNDANGSGTHDVEMETADNGDQSPQLTTLPEQGKRARAPTTVEDYADDGTGEIVCPPQRQARTNTLHHSPGLTHPKVDEGVYMRRKSESAMQVDSIAKDQVQSPPKRQRSPTVLGEIGCQDVKPLTRQARTNTLHKSIRPTEDWSGTPAIEPRRRKSDPTLQLSVAQFFSLNKERVEAVTKISPADESGDLKDTRPSASPPRPDPDLLVADAYEPTDFADWLHCLDAHELDVPANGSCFYFALHGVKAAGFKTATLRLGKDNNRESNFYKSNVNAMLGAYLDEMLRNGSVQLNQLFSRYALGTEIPEFDKAVEQLKRHILSTGRRSVEYPSSIHRWAGTEEIMAAVLYLREPVFVWDVAEDGRTAVQMYFSDYIDHCDANSTEKVKIRALSAGNAFRILKTCLNHRVIPLVLALHHETGAGHFTAVRFKDEWYEAWNQKSSGTETMRDRMETAHTKINIPVVSRFIPNVKQRLIRTDKPSSTDTAVEASGNVFDSTAPPTLRSGQTTDSTNDCKDTLTNLSQNSPSNKEADNDVQARAEQSTISANAYASILVCADPENQADHQEKRAWTKAAGENQKAFTQWRSRVSKRGQAALGIRDSKTTLLEASEIIADSTSFWLGMARALPYPELFLATCGAKTLEKVGRDIICQARLSMIERHLAQATTAGQREVLLAWKTSISAETAPHVKWALCQSLDYWNRVRKQFPSSFVGRSLPGVEADERAKLIASLMAILGSSQSRWRSTTTAQQCDDLLLWMTKTENQGPIRDTLAELRCHNWTSLRPLMNSATTEPSNESVADLTGPELGHPPEPPRRS